MTELIRDGKGHLIGKKLDNGILLDGKGHLAGRYLPGTNTTLDSKGHFEGRGDQTLRLLDGNKDNV